MTDIEALAKRVAESDLVKRARKLAERVKRNIRFPLSGPVATTLVAQADRIEALERELADSRRKHGVAATHAMTQERRAEAAELALTTAPRDAGERLSDAEKRWLANTKRIAKEPPIRDADVMVLELLELIDRLTATVKP